MNKKIGFIGSGNMAAAMIGGIINSKLVAPKQLIISNRTPGKLERLKAQYGVEITLDNTQVAREADIVFLAVKPHQYPEVIAEIKESISEQTVIVSIAAGQSIADMEAAFGSSVSLVRSMPNTPALVKKAMSALVPNVHVTKDELSEIVAIFNSFGQCEIVTEAMIDSVIAVSGSSPAYVYVMIEAMADAAVLQGMPREQAYRFASQAVLGAAQMVLETGMHPGALKDAVCSPGGTTIEAVAELEKSGFRGSIMKVMEVCANKSRKL